jgi:hypothetical protein
LSYRKVRNYEINLQNLVIKLYFFYFERNFSKGLIRQNQFIMLRNGKKTSKNIENTPTILVEID